MYTKSDKIRFVKRAFGGGSVDRDRANIAVWCPACAPPSKQKRKLIIQLDDQRYHCWVCGIKGRSLRPLIRKYATQYFEEYTKGWGCTDTRLEEAVTPEESVTLPSGFVALATATNTKDPDVKAVISYAHRRGLATSDLWRFRLGTCTKGRYRRRLIIPSFDAEGTLNYLVARTIDSTTIRKYINSKVSKKNVIFNELNINWEHELTLVEGPFDLMKASSNATCLLGSSLADDSELFRQIITHSTPVLLALDPDAILKAHVIAKKLSEFGVSVRLIPPDKFERIEDVGAMSKQQFDVLKDQAIMWSPIQTITAKISRLRSGSFL